MLKTALVIGSTGMVGRELVKLLCEDPAYGKVLAFARRASGFTHEKLEERIIDFARPEEWRDAVRGDALFSCLGTTKKQAGSKEEQFAVDFAIQNDFAMLAAQNGVPNYALVSSAGADAGSLVFYLRMKGQLDLAVAGMPFAKVRILRPNALEGNRAESRPTEEFGLKFLHKVNEWGIMKKYSPIQAKDVARGMIAALESPERFKIISGNDIRALAR